MFNILNKFNKLPIWKKGEKGWCLSCNTYGDNNELCHQNTCDVAKKYLLNSSSGYIQDRFGNNVYRNNIAEALKSKL